MFDRFILILPGVSKHYGTKKAGDFLYREEHKAFIYKGTEYPLDQFNAIVPKVVELNRDFMAELPYPRLLEAPACEVQPLPDPTVDTRAAELIARLTSESLTADDVNFITERCVASGFPVGLPPAVLTDPVPSPPSPEDSQAGAEEGTDPGRQHSVVEVAGGETDGPSGVSEAPVSTGAEATTQPEATPAANPAPSPEAEGATPPPAAPTKKAATKKAPAKKAAPKPKDDDQAQP